MPAEAMAGISHDIIFAWRMLRKNPGFASAAVLLLSAGIGGNTLIFSALNAILLRPLPVLRPQELARIVEQLPNRPLAGEFPYPWYEEWRARSATFAGAFAQSDLDVSLTIGSTAQPIRAQIVTGNYFSVLGIGAQRGRLLTNDDEWATQGGVPAVLSHAFWMRRFHGDPNVVGSVLHLNRHPFVVAGVLPQGFNGITVETGPDIRVPFIAGKFLTEPGARTNDPRRCCLWEIAGRLRPGVTLAVAQSETLSSFRAGAESAWLKRNPATEADRRWLRNFPLRVEGIERGVSRLRDQFSLGLLLLLVAVFLLLLLACANVAGLLLARAAARGREIATRLAIGATRGRLVRQWLVESFLLSVLGGSGALFLTWACLPALVRFLPPMRDLMTVQLPVTLEIKPDVRLFAYALLVCALTGVFAGLTPAWHVSRTGLMSPLKTAGADPRRLRARAMLVMIQAAIGTAVLADAALLVKTLHHLQNLDAGFDRDHIVTFTVDPSLQKYSNNERKLLNERLVEETRNVPGVRSASTALRGVMRSAGLKTTVGVVGSRLSFNDQLNASMNVVSPGYFETMGMHFVRGRDYGILEREARKPAPVVVNQAFARRFLPGENPIGQRLGTGYDRVIQPEYEVIGVVSDTKYRSLREPLQPTIFECLCQTKEMGDSSFQMQVRTYGKPDAVIQAAQDLLRRIDPRLPFVEIRTLREEVQTSLWQERLLSRVTSLFALLAVFLAGIGLYGLLAYNVAQHSREIGIRMALGAGPADIARAVCAPILTFVLAGIAFGLVACMMTTRWIQSLLYGVSAIEPLALALAAIVPLLVSLLAAWLPAMRASRLNPAVSLREQA